MMITMPDLNWYITISKRMNISPRCPFATVESCPRYYQSLSLLGSAGSATIDNSEDERLLKKWGESDLWPKTREQETIVYGNNKFFDKFCPEVSFESFGYFASFLGRYSDELDHDLAHKRLGEIGASSDDYRWAWSSVVPMHYAECPLCSVLVYRHNGKANNISKENHYEWYKRPFGMVIIGIIITIIGGLLLSLIRNPQKDPAIAHTPSAAVNTGVNNGGNVAGRDIIVNIGPGGAKTSDTNRIITLKQKSKMVDALITNRGSISIVYVRGDQKAEQYAKEIRDIFNTAYWHTSIEAANLAGFDRGLIASAKKMSDRINVIITAFDAGDINIKPWIDPHMKEEELSLKVGSP
jgi:hypothetical protein